MDEQLIRTISAVIFMAVVWFGALGFKAWRTGSWRSWSWLPRQKDEIQDSSKDDFFE